MLSLTTIPTGHEVVTRKLALLYHRCTTSETGPHSSMTAIKTETLTIRLCPETKAALRHMAEHERRSLSNMLEIMIRDYRLRHPEGAPTPPSWPARSRAY